jgi:hypothetical protein
MPLETRILRNNEQRTLRWGYFHLNCMYTAAIKESVPEMKGLIAGDDEKTFGDLEDGQFIDFSNCYIYGLNIPGCPLVERGEQTLLHRHEFTDLSDGEVFVLEPGDVLQAWRSHKR